MGEGLQADYGRPRCPYKARKEAGWVEYYELVLCYVDDVICVSHKAVDTLREIMKGTFTIKEDKVEPPNIYLGAQLIKKPIEGQECWVMSSEKYVLAAVQNVKERLEKLGRKLPTHCDTPLTTGYRPKLDESDELDTDGIQFFQELIGMLRWMVELGRIDIMMEVSMLLLHLVCPRQRHLDEALRIFGHLKSNYKRSIAFGPRYPDVDQTRFVTHDWYDVYRDAKEPMSD